jgi:glucosamine 6-phosphate synthetase-like amidotransferase/phosphosugar isomerase protein
LCGIAGYSLSAESRVETTLAAQTLLAAVSERGADAVGYCYRGPSVPLAIFKQRSGASVVMDAVDVPFEARQVLVHVRDYTKGHPSIAANNHPVRHGAVAGIHNGIIRNDEDIFARHGFERAEPDMTVDSEAIFALVERYGSSAKALNEVYGSMASAWVDDRLPEVVFLARGVGRPLWIGEGRNELFFASTPAALDLVERYTGIRLGKREVAEGTLMAVVAGRLVRTEAWQPDRSFTEEPLPAVRAPDEQRSCLALLAALAAPAAGR